MWKAQNCFIFVYDMVLSFPFLSKLRNGIQKEKTDIFHVSLIHSFLVFIILVPPSEASLAAESMGERRVGCDGACQALHLQPFTILLCLSFPCCCDGCHAGDVSLHCDTVRLFPGYRPDDFDDSPGDVVERVQLVVV